MSDSHSSIPVRREVGRQAGYCSLRELFLSIYSIRRSMTKMFMYYDNFVSVVRQKRKIRRRWNLFRYTFLSASINIFVEQHARCNKKREVKPLL